MKLLLLIGLSLLLQPVLAPLVPASSEYFQGQTQFLAGTHENTTAACATGLALNESSNGLWALKKDDAGPGERWRPGFAFDNKSFTTYENHAPVVSLTSPADNGTISNTTAVLRWNGSDPDGDRIGYSIFLSKSEINTSNLSIPYATTRYDNFTLNGLDDRATYFWTVVPNDGYVNGTPPVPRNFTVILNHPPTVSLRSPADNSVILKPEALLCWTGSDPDGDSLTYDVFLSSSSFDAAHLPTPSTSTAETSFLAGNLTPNAIYYWAIMAGDGLLKGPCSPIWRFKYVFQGTGRNGLPSATLIRPEDGATVNTTSTGLQWNGTDPDGDVLTFFVIASRNPFNSSAPPEPLVRVSDNAYILSNLTNGTYFWTVIPNDGKDNGTVNAVWSFRVNISSIPPPPPKNRPPIFTSEPVLNATVGETYRYNATASDEDGDELIFILLTSFVGRNFDPSTGQLTWIPSDNQTGNLSITILVSDGNGGVANQTFSVHVKSKQTPPPAKPSLSIGSPPNGTTVNGQLTVTGTSLGGNASILQVQLRIDDGEWMNATGTDNWSILIDTAGLENGQHLLEAKAFDGQFFSDSDVVLVTVDNPTSNPPQEPTRSSMPVILILEGIICAGIIGAVIHVMMKRQKK